MVHTTRFTTTSTGAPSTPQSSWQPYTNSNIARRPLGWVFCPHAQEPHHEPVIPEVIRPTQYGSAPQRLLVPRSDSEILTLFDDDTSSERDDYTTWVTADPTTFRARHMTDKGDAAPVFREPYTRTCGSSPSEYKFDTRKPNRLLALTRISVSGLGTQVQDAGASLLYRKLLNVYSTKPSQTVFTSPM